MPKINREKLGALMLPLPPLSEQMEIERRIDNFISISDPLLQQASAAILLLQERRASLISAAVTGKIDVRQGTVQQAAAA